MKKLQTRQIEQFPVTINQQMKIIEWMIEGIMLFYQKYSKNALYDSNATSQMIPTESSEKFDEIFFQNAGKARNIKAYYPKHFINLIQRDKSFIFEQSLNIQKNNQNIKKAAEEGFGEGGVSGAIFLFSHDLKLLLKTIRDSEFDSFSQIAEDYCNHIDSNCNSILAKIYGLYELKIPEHGISYSFILMKNIQAGITQENIIRKYDLKGSSIHRQTLKKDPEALKKKKTLKDLDLIYLQEKILISPVLKERVICGLKLDVEFLAKHELIDYSLLLLIVKKQQGNEEKPKGLQNFMKGLMKFVSKQQNFIYDDLVQLPSANNPELSYNLGIIDYLQKYNARKKMEKYLLKVAYLNPNANTSVQDPKFYAERFEKFVLNLF